MQISLPSTRNSATTWMRSTSVPLAGSKLKFEHGTQAPNFEFRVSVGLPSSAVKPSPGPLRLEKTPARSTRSRLREREEQFILLSSPHPAAGRHKQFISVVMSVPDGLEADGRARGRKKEQIDTILPRTCAKYTLPAVSGSRPRPVDLTHRSKYHSKAERQRHVVFVASRNRIAQVIVHEVDVRRHPGSQFHSQT